MIIIIKYVLMDEGHTLFQLCPLDLHSFTLHHLCYTKFQLKIGNVRVKDDSLLCPFLPGKVLIFCTY